MTVLTFFIIISMSMSGQVVNVLLPEAKGSEAVPGAVEQQPTLVIGLNAQQQILSSNEPITSEQLIESMQSFLQDNPEGIIILKADRSLPYRQVTDLLKTMRDIGGSQVILSIAPN